MHEARARYVDDEPSRERRVGDPGDPGRVGDPVLPVGVLEAAGDGHRLDLGRHPPAGDPGQGLLRRDDRARLLRAAPGVDADRLPGGRLDVGGLLPPRVHPAALRYPILIVGILFNIGLWTTVKIEFFGVVACFAAFLPLERYEQAVRRRLRRPSPASTSPA